MPCRECGTRPAGGQRRPPLRSVIRSAVERADVGIGPYESVTRSAFGIGRAGKSAKRRQWRMQRGDFEEVPRLAAATVAGNRLARRWAREPRPYGGVTRSAMRGGIPSHGFAVPAPFRQGSQGDGGCGLPRARCALAMTVFLQGAGARPGGSSGRPTPTDALLVVRRGGALPLPRATARVAPTEGLQGVREKNPPVTGSH